MEGRRVGYDKMWGALLALSCFLPMGGLWAEAAHWAERAWLAAGTVAGFTALVVGFAGWRSRWRHFLNFLLGVTALALPLFWPVIWERHPFANPARLPFRALGSVGWVMLVALAAVYAGAGIRVVRPSQITGQALGALGALMLALFACLPTGGEEEFQAMGQVQLLGDFETHWRTLVPFLLVVAAILFGVLNLVRSRAEVLLARAARLCLVGALLFWLSLPFLEKAGGLQDHVPVAWGALRFFGPLFLALDGAVAFVAISITRSND